MPPSRPPDPSEALLVTRAIAGDREAFGDLYERHRVAIYRYVFYRAGEAGEAEDLTETVFLKAWKALDRYQPSQAPFTAWLYRIAHNLLVDRHRTRTDWAPLEEDYLDSASDSDPELQAVAHEQAAVISRSLTQLDPSYQHVLTLRFVNGLSRAETAQVMGRTDGAIRMLQHRALAALRALLVGKVDDHD